MTTSNNAFRNSIVAALGGFLFGFDTAVISGVETTIQTLWSLDKVEHGFTVASALLGTVIGSVIAGRPAEAYGRKKVLQGIGLLYVVTSLGAALTSSWPLFIAFRLLGGIGVGASSVVGPMYISEISPAHRRGRLVALFQFNVVTGILIAFISNYFLYGISEDSWRWMLGVQAIPSLFFFSMVFVVPESPRWLMKKMRVDEAKVVLQSIGEPDVNGAIVSIQQSLQKEQGVSQENLFSNAYRQPILFAMGLAMFNQLSGINAIMYYAPRIFEMAGLGAHSSLLSTVGIGMINFIFTLFAINIIDKVGRKTLMLIGSVGLIASLFLVAFTFYSGNFSGFAIPVYIMIFIAFFAFSQGAVIWVFISEIFPNQVRAKGQTLGSSTHWIMAAIISWTFPVIVAGSPLGGYYSFIFYSIMMMVSLIFIWRVMPETKGKSLEAIQKQLGIE